MADRGAGPTGEADLGPSIVPSMALRYDAYGLARGRPPGGRRERHPCGARSKAGRSESGAVDLPPSRQRVWCIMADHRTYGASTHTASEFVRLEGQEKAA